MRNVAFSFVLAMPFLFNIENITIKYTNLYDSLSLPDNDSPLPVTTGGPLEEEMMPDKPDK